MSHTHRPSRVSGDAIDKALNPDRLKTLDSGAERVGVFGSALTKLRRAELRRSLTARYVGPAIQA